MEIEFWGVRGSIPSPGPATAQFGGNTACVEIRPGGSTLIVFDAGTGIRKLGERIVREGEHTDIHIFLSHTHWDHIQGLPFFAPLFSKKFNITIYGPANHKRDLKEILSSQMDYTYFPVRVEELSSNPTFLDIVEGEISIDGVKIRSKYVNHPVACLSYRIERDGKSFVYLTDHEPYRSIKASPSAPHSAALKENIDALAEALVDFARAADLLCIDGQYTKEEYETKIGWGHSSVDDSYDFARSAHVKEMIVFHHDPDRSDTVLQKILFDLQDRSWSALAEAIPLRLAREGQIIPI